MAINPDELGGKFVFIFYFIDMLQLQTVQGHQYKYSCNEQQNRN